MAEIEIAPLVERLSEQEIAELTRQLAKVGVDALPEPEEDYRLELGDGLDEDALQEILDRLDEHDAIADLYVPADFEGKLEVARLKVGSLVALLEALRVVKEELALDDDEDDSEESSKDAGEEEEDDRALLGGGQLRRSLTVFYEGAKAAYDKLLSLYVSY